MLHKYTGRSAVVFVVIPALLALSALVAVGAASANNVPREGTRINLFPGFVGPTAYSADTPFFVNHGWGCDAQAADAARDDDGCLKPTTTFKLFVDGKQVPSITDLEVGAGGLIVGKSQVSTSGMGCRPACTSWKGSGGSTAPWSSTLSFR